MSRRPRVAFGVAMGCNLRRPHPPPRGPGLEDAAGVFSCVCRQREATVKQP